MVYHNEIRDIALSHFKDNKSTEYIYEAFAGKVSEVTIRRWRRLYLKKGNCDAKVFKDI